MAEAGIVFELVQAPGERVPLPGASFDLVHSEHGAATWADPRKWIPEAARLLRPGGRLVPAEWARQWPCEEIWVARKP